MEQITTSSKGEGKRPYLSVVIPAYNEETRIPRTLLALDHYLSAQKYAYEILVVNDGSTDNTAQVVKRFETLVSHMRFVHNEKNHGKGYVVRQGMLEAQGNIRLFMDADNSTTIDHFEKMIPLFEQGYDVVIGSRESKDAPEAKQAISQPFVKRLVGDMANLLIQIVAVPGIWDTQAGFKACTASAAQEIFSRARINRWGFDIEMLALTRALRLRLGIIPTYWVNDPNSHVTLRGYLNTFRELFIIRLNLWRNLYNLPKGGIPDSPDASSLVSSLQEKAEVVPQIPPTPDTPAELTHLDETPYASSTEPKRTSEGTVREAHRSNNADRPARKPHLAEVIPSSVEATPPASPAPRYAKRKKTTKK